MYEEGEEEGVMERQEPLRYQLSGDESLSDLPEQVLSLSDIELTMSDVEQEKEEPKKVHKTKKKICAKLGYGKKEQQAMKYFRRHQIMKFLGFLMEHVLANRPDDIRRYLIDLLDRCILFRSGISDEAPTLFKDQHILSLYSSMDQSGVGSITDRQYRIAMTTLGITEYPSLHNRTLSAKKDASRISKEDFLSIAKMCLIEQLLDLIVVPVPSEESSESPAYSVRDSEATPTPSEESKRSIHTPNLISLLEGKEKTVEEDEDRVTDEEKEIQLITKLLRAKKDAEKPEVLFLADHPQLKLKIFDDPKRAVIVDRLKFDKIAIRSSTDLTLRRDRGNTEDENLKPPSFRFSSFDYTFPFAWYPPPVIPVEEGDVKASVTRQLPIPRLSALFTNDFMKKTRQGKPLTSNHSKGWYKPVREFWKIMDKTKEESRKKLIESWAFLKDMEAGQRVVFEEDIEEDVEIKKAFDEESENTGELVEQRGLQPQGPDQTQFSFPNYDTN